MSDTHQVGGTPQHDPDLGGDPDLDPVSPDEVTTSLEQVLSGLDQALKAEVAIEDIVLAVKMRPGVSVRYCPSRIDDEKLTAWRKRAKSRAHKETDGIDPLRFASIVLGNCCGAVLFNGQEAIGDDGRPLTFASPHIHQLYGVTRATDAIKLMIANDAHVMLTASRVMEEAGYSDEIDVDDAEEGPTQLD